MTSALIFTVIVAFTGSALLASLVTVSVVRNPVNILLCAPHIQYYSAVGHICVDCLLGGGCLQCDPLNGACLECPPWYNISGTGCLRSNALELCEGLAPLLPEGCTNCTLACNVCGATCNDEFQVSDLDLGSTLIESGSGGPAPTVLCNFEAMVFLNLTNTNISSFPACFRTLTAMRELDAAHNLPMDIGNVPLQLTALNLSFTNLSDISPLCEVTTLESVDLCYCNIASIPECFGALTRLRTLSLCHNLLTALPDSFRLLTSLTYLDLKYNALPGLEFDLPSMRRRRLVGVGDPNSVGDLHALVILDVSHNSLTALPTTIGDCSTLKYVYLQYNLLTTLPTSFGSLVVLDTADLSHNTRMTSLPATIGSLVNLVYLDISSNTNLTALPANFGSMRSLVTLIAATHRLLTLPTSFGNLTSLVELTLTDGGSNGIVLPDEFCKLSNLELLNLATNSKRFTTLPSCIGSLSKLTYLWLSGCNMSAIPSSIGALAALTLLNMEACHITTMPAEIGNLTMLNTLYLYGNALTSLPDSFGSLQSLKNLDMPLNSLTALPTTFGSLRNLARISIRANNLTNLPASFASLTALTWLNIGEHPNNYAAGLNDSLFENIPLETLYINGVHLTTLPVSLYTRTSLMVFSASANPYIDLPNSLYLPNLTYFNIQPTTFSPLVRFPTGLCNSTKLQTLQLLYMSPTALPDCFDKFTNLMYFSVSTHNLTAVPASFDHFAPTLTSLTLTGKYSTNVPAIRRGPLTSLNVSHLTALTYLELGNNRLSALIGLENLANLTFLGVSVNNFTTLPNMTKLTKLATLSLSFNYQLTSLPASISSCTALTVLQTWSCTSLHTLPPLNVFPNFKILYANTMMYEQAQNISGLTSLIAISNIEIYSNATVIAAPDVSGMTNLQCLQVKSPAWSGAMNFDNSFKTAGSYGCALQISNDYYVTAVSASGEPHWSAITALSLTNGLVSGRLSLNYMPLLTTLAVGNNSIVSLGTNLSTVKLTSFYADRNLLSSLPLGLSRQTALTTISLYQNLLTVLPSDFNSLTKVTALDLSTNQLPTLGFTTFDLLSKIVTLTLHHNLLTTLPTNMTKLTAMTTLYLQNNLLSTLPATIVNCAALTTLNIDYNFLNCVTLNSTLPAGTKKNFVMAKCNATRQYHLGP